MKKPKLVVCAHQIHLCFGRNVGIVFLVESALMCESLWKAATMVDCSDGVIFAQIIMQMICITHLES